MLPLDSLPELSASDSRLTVIELPKTGPDIVKVDVEGYELEVLAGMRKAIYIFRPILIIECLSPERLQVTHDYLREFSYTPLLIDEKEMSLIGDVGEYCMETTRNVLFYPHIKQSVIEQIHDDSGVAIRL